MSVAKWDTTASFAGLARARRAAVASEHFGDSILAGMRPDLLRRFSRTLLTTDLQLMGRTVRLETNSQSMLDQALKFFKQHQHGAVNKPDFLWRLVCEPDVKVQSTAVPLSAFSDMGLRYVNFGQRSFLAIDLEAREGVGFLADAYLEGEARLRHRPPLDILFCMTAASLGLICLSGGCVGRGDRGVLIFGPPNSGKTTACYHAARMGLEFQADQVVFLDTHGPFLNAWGDPFPAVFRPQTLEYLPELRGETHQSEYAELSFYYFDKSSLQAGQAKPVTPVCSLFLDRSASLEARLRKLSKQETAARLRASLLFEEELRFESQIIAALEELAEEPAYLLEYGGDPKIAADCIEELLR